MKEGPTSITFLNRFYWPDVAATGQMLTDLAEDLAADGWKVTVVASRAGYVPGAAPLPREEIHNGVRIIRVRTTRFGRDRLAGRMGDYVSYLSGALFKLLRLPRTDLVVAMSDPPFLLAAALLAGRLRGSQVVYWLQDLYPHLAGRLGVLRQDGRAYRAAHAVARRLHERCDAVVTLGPRMSEVMEASGAPRGRVAHVHNWADASAVTPVPAEENHFLREHGLEGKFVVLYSGNAGRAHTFGAVIESMRRLRADASVRFLFIGGGKGLPMLRDAVEREGLPNVQMMDYVPRSELRYSLSAAGVSLVTEAPEVVGLLVPSKTYGILASGRPVIFVGSQRSDVAAVILEAGAGVVVDPDDPDALVAAILALRDDPATARAMGERARAAAESLYDRPIATRAWARTVTALTTT